jgi:hypothetical protein
MENMLRNKCFLQAGILHVLRFVSVCPLFTESASYLTRSLPSECPAKTVFAFSLFHACYMLRRSFLAWGRLCERISTSLCVIWKCPSVQYNCWDSTCWGACSTFTQPTPRMRDCWVFTASVTTYTFTTHSPEYSFSCGGRQRFKVGNPASCLGLPGLEASRLLFLSRLTEVLAWWLKIGHGSSFLHIILLLSPTRHAASHYIACAPTNRPLIAETQVHSQVRLVADEVPRSI